MNVTKTILAMQSEFFEKGPAYLKPLKQSEVAETDRHPRVHSQPRRAPEVSPVFLGNLPHELLFLPEVIQKEKGRSGKSVSVQGVKSA